MGLCFLSRGKSRSVNKAASLLYFTLLYFTSIPYLPYLPYITYFIHTITSSFFLSFFSPSPFLSFSLDSTFSSSFPTATAYKHPYPSPISSAQGVSNWSRKKVQYHPSSIIHHPLVLLGTYSYVLTCLLRF